MTIPTEVSKNIHYRSNIWKKLICDRYIILCTSIFRHYYENSIHLGEKFRAIRTYKRFKEFHLHKNLRETHHFSATFSSKSIFELKNLMNDIEFCENYGLWAHFIGFDLKYCNFSWKNTGFLKGFCIYLTRSEFLYMIQCRRTLFHAFFFLCRFCTKQQRCGRVESRICIDDRCPATNNFQIHRFSFDRRVDCPSKNVKLWCWTGRVKGKKEGHRSWQGVKKIVIGVSKGKLEEF